VTNASEKPPPAGRQPWNLYGILLTMAILFVPGGPFLLLVAGLYLIPSMIAAKRGLQNVWSIFGLNLLLGWTLVGWVTALCWVVAGTAQVRLVPP
jgi:energy-coupling factor transporter transmembrane protein EcfT